MPLSFRHRLASALLILSAIGLISCNKDEKGNVLGPNGVALSGDVILKILDANTRQPLEDAAISLVGGPEGKTGKDGQVTLKGVKSGGYFVRVEKAGFETSESSLDAALKGELTPVPVITSKSIMIYRKGVKVKGRIFVRPDRKSAQRDAENVTVELRMTGAFLNPLRTAKTNADGEYAFDSLPELTSCAVRTAEFTVEGKTYRLGESAAVSGNLLAGESQTVPVAMLEPVTRGMLQVLTASPAVLEKGKALRIEFTAKVDTSTLETGSIVLRLNSGTLAAALSWDADFRVLEVKPYQSDWSLGTYTVSLSGFNDVEGNPIGSGLGGSVSVSGALAAGESPLTKLEGLALRASIYIARESRNVDTNVVDYFTSMYRLHWKKAGGASAYDIYTREASDSAWRLQTQGVVDTQTTLSFGSPINGKPLARQHMVVPRGTGFSQGFDLAASLEVKDGVKPVIYVPGSATSSFGAFNNISGIAAKTAPVTVSLTTPTGSLEPLDTSKVPELSVREGCRTALSSCDSTYVPKPLRFRWTSRTSGIAEVEVEAGKDGRQDTLIIDFSKVTDLGGNGVEGSTGGPAQIRHIPF